MIPAALHHLGPGLLGSLARGFAWSVGWLFARWLEFPAAAIIGGVVGALVWWRFLRRRRRVTDSASE